MTGRNLLSVAFGVIGLFFAVIALVVAAYALAFVLRSDHAVGVIVDHRSVQNQITVMPRSDQTGVLYYPVIAYTPSGGAEHIFTGPSGRSKPQFQVGQEVSVLISRSDAGDARLNTLLGVWGTPIMLGGLAAIFLILGLAAPMGFGGMQR
ncbi:MAG: DUF3592 domain-containing protein [Spirochaetia bacterium]